MEVCESVEAWRFVKVWRFGGMEVWESVEAWRFGGVEICENVEAWRFGDVEVYLLLIGVRKVLLLHLSHDKALVLLVARHRAVVETIVFTLVSKREHLGKVFQLSSNVWSRNFSVTPTTPVPRWKNFADLEKLARTK